jgi:hypothetical protein
MRCSFLVVDDDYFSCYFLITSSAARGNILLTLYIFILSILIVKVPNYNCFYFTKRLSIINRKRENFTAPYCTYSIHQFSLFTIIQNLSNRGILRIPNIFVLTSRSGTKINSFIPLLLMDKLTSINWIMDAIDNTIMWMFLVYLIDIYSRSSPTLCSFVHLCVLKWKLTFARLHSICLMGILPLNIHHASLRVRHSSGMFALHDIVTSLSEPLYLTHNIG